ncbi:MAG TPA: amidohydrolase family protein [Acidimicrobiales bacterium]|nr:amidohydrolase family protein [Acidimicrobiales bacterium]
MTDIPKIISVDDHVVEPPHVWQTWLPKKYRETGPRVVRERFGSFSFGAGARYDNDVDDEGQWGDAWVYEDKITYVHKRHVAIPLDATPGGDTSKFDVAAMTMTAMTYDEMRPGCYDRDARVEEFEQNWVDGSLAFPTFPRFCGQTFSEGKDKELGLACVKAYNDWMVEEWCAPSAGVNIPLGIIPLWDADLAAREIVRNASRGVHAVAFSELPHALGLPSIHSGFWDPVFQACNDTDTVLCMHVGSSSNMPMGAPDAPKGALATIAFNNAMTSLGEFLFSGIMERFPTLRLAYSEGQVGWIPFAVERSDYVWEHHHGWMGSRDHIAVPPSTYYYGRVFGCFTSDYTGMRNIKEVGEDQVCFETDYPHTDTSWPNSKEEVTRMCAGLSDELVYKVVRGNAIEMLKLDRV